MSHLPPRKRINSLTERLNGFDPSLVSSHLTRLDLDYFNQFNDDEIRDHVKIISLLTGTKQCLIRLKKLTATRFNLTITGFDFQGLFSIISGLMTIYDFNIESGKIFTYHKAADQGQGQKPLPYYLKRKKIIDYLEVTYVGLSSFPEDTEEILQMELDRYTNLLQENRYLEARNHLTKRIGTYLSNLADQKPAKLLPIEIDIDVEQEYTRLDIQGMDTPAFLFSLSNALTLKGISIHNLYIQTDKNIVHDTIYITDLQDRPLTDPGYLDLLKMAVVLIKQFTQLLPLASDFDLAVRHFDQFLDAVMTQKDTRFKIADFNNTDLLSTLAKIFGTGNYLWEEFIRMQYTNMLPLLKNSVEFKKIKAREEMQEELKKKLKGRDSLEKKIDIINQYKDSELFRIDISHLIYHNRTIIDFSQELSDLAEVVICTTTELLHAQLTKEYGEPRTDQQIAPYVILALGKFGGQELGYASDLELVLVYDGAGFTDHPSNSITVAEFFIILVQRLKSQVRVRQKGIFEIDLRLRPYGNKGQLATSVKLWKEYYSPSGNAHAYERQALIRLRPIHGDKNLSRRILEIRDQVSYGEPPVPLAKILELRKKQLKTLVEPGSTNAKYSQGGLADLEYTVQFLQLQHGKEFPQIRKANTVKALESMLEYGILSPSEFEKLYNSYAFLRRLINAMRMVRGHAKDLVIPPFNSDQFLFLAKRLGYVSKEQLSVQEQLRRDLDSGLNTVTRFFTTRFIEQSKAPFLDQGITDILLKENPQGKEIKSVLSGFAVVDAGMVFTTLRTILSHTEDKNGLLAVLVLAERHIRVSPDPDKVFINLEKFLLKTQDGSGIIKQLLFHPFYLKLLVIIFSHSDYLANIITNEPQLLEFLADQETLNASKSFGIFRKEIIRVISTEKTLTDKMDSLRKYRNREIMRIGLRDIYLNVPLQKTTKEISDLSDALIQAVYTLALATLQAGDILKNQAVIAMGKLGGRELNYSSDIDLIFVAEEGNDMFKQSRLQFDKVNRMAIGLLTESSPFGQLFRVDMRLRPYGRSSNLTGAFQFYKDYYQDKADGWELQAWLKARVIAGKDNLGQQLIDFVHQKMLEKENTAGIARSIKRLRTKKLKQLDLKGTRDREVKQGPGGIRSIEFLVQNLQILNGRKHPDLITGHTLQALDKLLEHHLLTDEDYKALHDSYLLLRKIEHRIQLQDLRQSHLLPEDETELARLAKRCGYEDRLQESALSQFTKDFQGAIETVRKLTERAEEAV